MYDLVIIGSGPAGLTAAIYMARARYRVLVVEKENTGGQITITSEVVNYPGILSVSGKELTATMKIQADSFGAEFAKDQITGIQKQEDGTFIVKGTRQEYRTLAVVIATGAHPRRSGFTGEDEFRGRGVAYRYAKSVTINVRKARFSCAQSVVDELKKHDKIKVNFNTEVVEVSGSGVLQKVVLKNNQTGDVTEHTAPQGDMLGVFVFAGYEPETGWIRDSGCGVELDESGYIVTDANRKTTVDGIYAAGDVCIKNLRQVVTAVSDGAVAATEAEKHAAAMHEKLGLPQFEVRAVNRPAAAPVEAPKEEKASTEQGGSFITDQIRAQLVPLFDKFSSTVTIKGEINRTSFGREIASFIGEFKGMSPNVLTRIEEIATDSDSQNVPVIKILNSAGEETGLEFHAVPGGHEFNSFIIGLYNVAGPGQKIDDEDLAGISKIISEKNVRIFVSLSCTMCPETVMSAQKIATMSNRVSVKVYDLQHFPDLKEKYQIMSVPCIVINDESPQFGKKNISQFLDLLTK